MLFLVTYLYMPAKGTTVRDSAVIAAESEQDARNEFHSTYMTSPEGAYTVLSIV